MARISTIEITNILGTKHASFKPGTLTLVTGRNGDGKTSILDALKQIWEGGHDPAILRRGAKFGEAVLTLDDGTVIKLRVSAKTTTYEITDPNGNEVKAPRAFIEQLGDCLAIDPARILLAKPKELASILLEVMPIRFSRDELQSAITEETYTVNRDMTMDEFEDLRKQIYDLRTTANRQAKEAQSTTASLRKSLPDCDINTDWTQRAVELREVLEDTKRSREADVQQIDRDEREAIEAIKARAMKEIEEVRERSRQQKRDKDAEHEPTILKIRLALEEAEIRGRDRDRAEGIRLSLERFTQQAAKADSESRSLTNAIDSLDELKQAKLSQLPVPGLEVRDGQVYADGIPFEHKNLAERIKIAFQIAALRSGSLPFMVLDQAEAFDTETWDAFKAGAIESGFQIIAARVSDAPLEISIAA